MIGYEVNLLASPTHCYCRMVGGGGEARKLKIEKTEFRDRADFCSGVEGGGGEEGEVRSME